MTRAMILCAGLGTRLGALSDELPKPLLPVCGVPILRYGIELLVRHDIRDIVINLHHHGALISEALGDGSELGARIHYTHESFPLGTGGGLKHALSLLDPEGHDEPFLSMNGKLIFDLDLRALLEAHARDPEVLGTLVVRRDPGAQSWGALDVREQAGRLRVHDVFGEGRHMFGGVHITRPSVVRRLPDGEACMIRQGYLPWLRAGEPVAAFEADPDAYFAEHSTPERYFESNLALVRGAVLRHPPAPLFGVDSTAHVATTARLRHPVKIGPRAFIGEGAVIGPDTVIGGHAVIEENAEVVRSVVWRGARVSEPIRDAVVTPREVTSIALTSPGPSAPSNR